MWNVYSKVKKMNYILNNLKKTFLRLFNGTSDTLSNNGIIIIILTWSNNFFPVFDVV